MIEDSDDFISWLKIIFSLVAGFFIIKYGYLA